MSKFSLCCIGPTAPEELKVTSFGTDSVTFDWTSPSSDHDTYYYELKASGTLLTTGNTRSSQKEFNDDDDDVSLTPGQIYNFVVYAVKSGLRGGASSFAQTLSTYLFIIYFYTCTYYIMIFVKL